MTEQIAFSDFGYEQFVSFFGAYREAAHKSQWLLYEGCWHYRMKHGMGESFVKVLYDAGWSHPISKAKRFSTFARIWELGEKAYRKNPDWMERLPETLLEYAVRAKDFLRFVRQAHDEEWTPQEARRKLYKQEKIPIRIRGIVHASHWGSVSSWLQEAKEKKWLESWGASGVKRGNLKPR